MLQNRADCDERRLAALEWSFLPVLTRNNIGPVLLKRWLAAHPRFFVQLLGCAFRSDNDSNHEPKTTAQVQAKARLAFELLHDWETVPGAQPDGSISAKELRDWIEEARRLAHESGHLSVCDSMIGRLLAHAPEDTDDSWPCQPVRLVLDAIGSKAMLGGFQIGIRSLHGVTIRGHHEGGDQERVLAQKFTDYATQIEIATPLTGALLQNVAQIYRDEAQREDDRAQWEA